MIVLEAFFQKSLNSSLKLNLFTIQMEATTIILMHYEHVRDVRDINTLAFKMFKLDTERIYEYDMKNLH